MFRRKFFIIICTVFIVGLPKVAGSTVEGQGTINLRQIGRGQLYVVTGQQDKTPINSSGKFTTSLSGLGPQMLFITDDLDVVWAKVLVVPNTNEFYTVPLPKINNIVVDKVSVANSLVIPAFFFGGDYEKTKRAVKDVERFTCMPNLLSQLTALNNTPLEKLYFRQEFLNAIKRCKEEFSNRSGNILNPIQKDMMDSLYDAEFLRGMVK